MPRRLLLMAWLLTYGPSALNAFGQGPPKPNPLELNAALVYWQAFAMIPQLSEAEVKIREDVIVGARPVDEEAKKIVIKSGEAMQYMHRASKFDHVAWGIAWEGGPYALLPHISKARELNRFAILHGVVRFEEGEHKKAIEDLLAAMRMGRQVSRDGVITLIPLLVDYSIEAVCVGVLARHLPKIDAETRMELKQGLAALPRSRTLTEAMQGEKDVFLPWLIAEVQKPKAMQKMITLVGNVPEKEVQDLKSLSQEELLASARRMGEYYDRMIAKTTLSPKKAEAVEKEMMEQIKRNGAKDLLTLWLMPNAAQGRHAEARQLTRLALLDAGLAVLEEGQDALKVPKHKDPFGDGPFDYQGTDNGFVLTSALDMAPDREKMSLTFGKKTAP